MRDIIQLHERNNFLLYIYAPGLFFMSSPLAGKASAFAGVKALFVGIADTRLKLALRYNGFRRVRGHFAGQAGTGLKQALRCNGFRWVRGGGILQAELAFRNRFEFKTCKSLGEGQQLF